MQIKLPSISHSFKFVGETTNNTENLLKVNYRCCETKKANFNITSKLSGTDFSINFPLFGDNLIKYSRQISLAVIAHCLVLNVAVVENT